MGAIYAFLLFFSAALANFERAQDGSAHVGLAREEFCSSFLKKPRVLRQRGAAALCSLSEDLRASEVSRRTGIGDPRISGSQCRRDASFSRAAFLSLRLTLDMAVLA